ncbi:MAG TPA: hypothetical protein VKU00_04215 [Chthonomonadaceae bacterium]|nr:hypothetical protein [Chthonomonadaceae bacterium]
MTEVPTYWLWVSGIYFVISILWSIGLTVGMILLIKKTLPILTEARMQVNRIGGQAKSIAAKASNTASIVHAQTQNLLGNAQSAGSMVTRQAGAVGAALTGLLIASRVVNFVRKLF